MTLHEAPCSVIGMTNEMAPDTVIEVSQTEQIEVTLCGDGVELIMQDDNDDEGNEAVPYCESQILTARKARRLAYALLGAAEFLDEQREA